MTADALAQGHKQCGACGEVPCMGQACVDAFNNDALLSLLADRARRERESTMQTYANEAIGIPPKSRVNTRFNIIEEFDEEA